MYTTEQLSTYFKLRQELEQACFTIAKEIAGVREVPKPDDSHEFEIGESETSFTWEKLQNVVAVLTIYYYHSTQNI